MWVRVVYNDKERLIAGSGASTTTLQGDVRIGGTWCPYERYGVCCVVCVITAVYIIYSGDMCVRCTSVVYTSIYICDVLYLHTHSYTPYIHHNSYIPHTLSYHTSGSWPC